MELYDKLCERSAQTTTNLYSTSFSLGIKSLNKSLRQPIYNIYGFVRLADEVVDSFHHYNQRALLEELEKQTFASIEQGISTNPILHAFQKTVNEYQIDTELIKTFLHSMSMDLEDIDYDEQLYQQYIDGSAEVVGLMCMYVFTKGDKDKVKELEPHARSLGAALQKVNFLRDVQSDYHQLSRTYFPGVTFDSFTDDDLRQIIADINKDFEHALIGIKQLEKGSKFAVYMVYQYFKMLLDKIEQTSREELLNKRLRISNARKLWVTAKSWLNFKFNLI